MRENTTWRKLIAQAMVLRGETWNDVVETTLSNEGLDLEFDNGYGGEEGSYFTLWTKERVYFPCCYDGSEWAGSVPRDPCSEANEHVGGG